MSSSFSWLDYSEAERRKALEVADSFKNRDTRDELGIGTVRDAFANLLFPGTTTIQTRAKYFLLIPWVYLGLEQRFRRRPPASREDVAKAARREEIALIDILKNSDDPDGTIGVEARENLKRLPSNVYWYGMGAWGIRKVDVSQDQYHKFLVKYGSPAPLRRGADDVDDLGAAYNWHPELLSLKPSSYPQKLSFVLSDDESEFLKDRIKGIKGRNASLLAVLADSEEAWEPLQFAWEHESAVNGTLPPEVKRALSHARNFSEVMYGASLLYNLMLARRFFKTFSALEDKIDFYEAEVAKWGGMITARKDAYVTWDRQQFWQIVSGQNPAIPNRTRSFIDAWLDLALTGKDPGVTATSENAQALVLNRERSHKPTGMARLVNENALRQWSGAAGASQLDFRWGVSQRLLTDILSPGQVQGSPAPSEVKNA
ncbi:DUF6361 family protein [Citrifermentans bremense]|nr:DUF6361 family protein [Citrifermentans bremense]